VPTKTICVLVWLLVMFWFLLASSLIINLVCDLGNVIQNNACTIHRNCAALFIKSFLICIWVFDCKTMMYEKQLN
jgi:hypothetical protein